MPFSNKKEIVSNSDKPPLVDYKIRVMRDAHLLATSVFPRQITELDELLRSLKSVTLRDPCRRKLLQNHCQHHGFTPKQISSSVSQGPNSTSPPAFRCRAGVLKICLVTFWDNSDVISLHTKISPLIQNMSDHCLLVRSWMVYLGSRKDTPIELRTNLKSDVLETLSGLEDFCQKTSNILSSYLSQRSALLEKCSTYPEVDDYKSALVDLDDAHYRKLHNVAYILRDSFISFLNRLLKTFETIRRLRRSDGSVDFLRFH